MIVIFKLCGGILGKKGAELAGAIPAQVSTEWAPLCRAIMRGADGGSYDSGHRAAGFIRPAGWVTRHRVSTLPQTLKAWPEMLRPAGEARKSAMLATSWGETMRRSETLARLASRSSAMLTPESCAWAAMTRSMRAP